METFNELGTRGWGVAIAAVLLLFWAVMWIKILREYERGVVFRLGRALPEPKGPGLALVFWPIDRMVRVSLRTVTEDIELRGVRMKQGAKVALFYGSANRDEDVFANPHRFDVTRDPNPHLAFGVGEHFCLGASLARMQLRTIFHEVVRRLPDMTVAEPPRRLRGNFIDGIKEMRVRYTPESRA